MSVANNPSAYRLLSMVFLKIKKTTRVAFCIMTMGDKGSRAQRVIPSRKLAFNGVFENKKHNPRSEYFFCFIL